MSCVRLYDFFNHHFYIFFFTLYLAIRIFKTTDRLNTSDTGALWIPFQTAAGTVTTLYKGK